MNFGIDNAVTNILITNLYQKSKSSGLPKELQSIFSALVPYLNCNFNHNMKYCYPSVSLYKRDLKKFCLSFSENLCTYMLKHCIKGKSTHVEQQI